MPQIDDEEQKDSMLLSGADCTTKASVESELDQML
jgi:hypothetical protein